MYKYTLSILVGLLFICGCNNEDKWENPNAENNKKSAKYGSGLSIDTINGCQYVIYQGNNSGDCAMVHAGNCNNPIHKTVKQ